MATKKLGDGFVALVLLAFVITLFSGFIIAMDTSTGLDSGQLNDKLSRFDKNTSEMITAQQSLVDTVDSATDFGIDNPDQQLDDRGSDSSGVMNVLGKNVFTKFAEEAKVAIPGSGIILNFIIVIVAIIFSILALRTIMGDSRI